MSRIPAILTQIILRFNGCLFDEFVIIYIFSIDSSGWERTYRQLTSQELYIKIDVPYSLHAKAFVARNRP